MEETIWKSDIGIDELGDNEFSIIISSDKGHNITVFGTTADECDEIANYIVEKLNS